MFNNTILDIGSESIKILHIVESKKNNHSQAFFESYLTEGVSFGYISNKNSFLNCLKKSISNFKKKYQVEIQDVLICLNDLGIHSTRVSVTKQLATPTVKQEDLNDIYKKAKEKIKLKNKDKILEQETIKYKLDESEIFSSPVGLKTSKITVEYLFITIPENNFIILEEVLEQSNISAEFFIPSLYGLSNISLTKMNKKLGSAIVDFGDQKTSILIYENGKPIYYNVLKIGSKNVTQKIAQKLTVNFKEAEKIKKQKVYSKKQKQIIEEELKKIALKIKEEIIKSETGGILPDGIVLSGLGSLKNNIEDVFKKVLKLPVKIDSKKAFGQTTIYNNAYGAYFYILNTTKKEKIKLNLNIQKIFQSIKKIIKKFKL